MNILLILKDDHTKLNHLPYFQNLADINIVPFGFNNLQVIFKNSSGLFTCSITPVETITSNFIFLNLDNSKEF